MPHSRETARGRRGAAGLGPAAVPSLLPTAASTPAPTLCEGVHDNVSERRCEADGQSGQLHSILLLHTHCSSICNLLCTLGCVHDSINGLSRTAGYSQGLQKGNLLDVC